MSKSVAADLKKPADPPHLSCSDIFMGASCSSLIQNNDWRMLSAEFHEALKKLQNLPPTRVKQGNAVPLADTFTVAGCSSLVQNKHWRMLSAEFHEALKKVPPTEVKQGNAILRHDTKQKTDTKATLCPPGKGSLCVNCGYTSECLNKCTRCGRIIRNGKLVNVPGTKVSFLGVAKTGPEPSPVADKSPVTDRSPVAGKVIGFKTVAKTGPGTSTVTAPVVQSIKDDVMQCPAGIGALCAKCGFVSRFYNCTRCGHKIIDGQLVDVFGLINGLAFQPTAPTTDKASGATSDNRYLPSPLTASKSEECRTVPLADKEVGGKASELMVLPDTRRLRPKKRCRPTRTDIEAVEDKDDYHDPSANVTTMLKDRWIDARDLRRWAYFDFKSLPWGLRCRMLHIGSYVTAPTSRVLFSEQGLLIEANKMLPDGRPSQHLANASLAKANIVKIYINFGAPNAAMFVWLSPRGAMLVRNRFNMRNANQGLPYFDVGSPRACERLLILLFHEPLDKDQRTLIESAFGNMDFFVEISPVEAGRMLSQASGTPQ